MKKLKLALLIGTIFGATSNPLFAETSTENTYDTMSVEEKQNYTRVLVKLSEGYTVEDLNSELGMNFQLLSEKSLGFKLLLIKENVNLDDLNSISFVESASLERIIKRKVEKTYKRENKVENQYQTMTIPNDPEYSIQYHFEDSNEITGGSSIQRAIDNLKESNNQIKIAIIDSGALTHSDIDFSGGQNIATALIGESERSRSEGYQDLSFYIDNTDPDNPVRTACANIVGHGLQVAGVIGANIDNSKGGAGILESEIYAVRVMEYDCENNSEIGYISDVADGIFWAAGAPVSGVSTPIDNPVDIINVSLGGIGSSCDSYLQAAINYATNKGITVVNSAGNEGVDITDLNTKISDCDNLIVVSANDINGELTTFSNYSDEKVTLSAFGGTEFDEKFRVLNPSTSDEYMDSYGTSFSSPVVAGIVGLLKEKYDNLNYSDVKYLLEKGAVDTPSVLGDGAGIANAYNSMVVAEQLYDFSVNFNHYYANTETCNDNKRVELMNKHFNVCELYKVTINQSSSNIPVTFEVVKKESTANNWSENNTTVVETVSVEAGTSEVSYKFNEKEEGYDYAVRICDENNVCVNHQILDFNSVSLPSFCEE